MQVSSHSLAISGLQDASIAEPAGTRSASILPSVASIPAFNHISPLTPVICDDRAISVLLEAIISKAGFSINEVARRLGTSSQNIRQYLGGRRSRPSLAWFIRLCTLCGTKVSIEFPA